MHVLNDVEVRVLGSLVEKEITTPEYYPLTLNSLTTACNQKSNREPVTSYDEATVADALDSLRDKDLVIVERGRDSRVPKYDNYFADSYKLSPAEVAVMNVLMLRGQQTLGEIRIRGERLHQFSELAEVEETLEKLASREEPLVVKLPRQPGQKESRYAHLLSGEECVIIEQPLELDADAGRVEQLEMEVASLRAELQELRNEFEQFKSQFE